MQTITNVKLISTLRAYFDRFCSGNGINTGARHLYTNVEHDVGGKRRVRVSRHFNGVKRG